MKVKADFRISSQKRYPNCRMTRLSFVTSVALLVVLASSLYTPSFSRDEIPDRLFLGTTPPDKLSYPSAPKPTHDKLVPPPGEEHYYPIRADGQPFVLNIENTINLTDYLNRFYYNPSWDGEVWAPADFYTFAERATRTMASWPEYSEFGELRVLNRVHRFIERASGFGP